MTGILDMALYIIILIGIYRINKKWLTILNIIEREKMTDLKNKWISIRVFADLTGIRYQQIDLWRDRPAFKKYVKEDGMNSSRIFYCDDAIRILNNYRCRNFSDDAIALKEIEQCPELPATALYN